MGVGSGVGGGGGWLMGVVKGSWVVLLFFGWSGRYKVPRMKGGCFAALTDRNECVGQT